MSRTWKRFLSLLLVATMVLSLGVTGFAADEDEPAEEPVEEAAGGVEVEFEQVDNDIIASRLPLANEIKEEAEPEYAEDEVVRVSIVLDGPSALEAGYAPASASSYRANLKAEQDALANQISAQALGGAQLNVVWNLTLAANIISAWVEYGQIEDIKNVIAGLKEVNPMMGLRGCRLAVMYPEIAQMQTRAVIRAAIKVSKAHPDWKIAPEIMIPLTSSKRELRYVRKIVKTTADEEIEKAGAVLKYTIGTMIEIPRAALIADEIATEADFFCFGTNDLTQMTSGFSRDDSGKFLDAYMNAKILESDPFAKLDQTGVGKLIRIAVEGGRKTNPYLHCGVCGEHGGDPSSIEFFNSVGMDYVSCSPFRVPIARLAAAQAALKQGQVK